VATRIWVISAGKLIEIDDPDPIFARLLNG
jgi:hypothetical protein